MVGVEGRQATDQAAARPAPRRVRDPVEADRIWSLNKNGYELHPLKLAFIRYLTSTSLPFAENQGVAGDLQLYLGGEKVELQKPANPQDPAKGRAVEDQKPQTGDDEGVELEERAAILEYDAGLSRRMPKRRRRQSSVIPLS